MTPREIVHELNRHIIGQDDAKRAVAIALRNRWRRMQLPVLGVFESVAEAQAARGQVDAITDALIKPLGIDDVQQALAQRLLVVGEGKSAGP